MPETRKCRMCGCATQELHGPFGWLNGYRCLSEDSWELEDDPIDNNDEYFSIPLYALTDPFKEIGKDAPAIGPADTGSIQALSGKEGGGPIRALMDVINERYRQISVEGWTPEHDRRHSQGELAVAAASYALNTADDTDGPYPRMIGAEIWPFEDEWWKPDNPRRDLVKAAALILAEIERLDREIALRRQGGKP